MIMPVAIPTIRKGGGDSSLTLGVVGFYKLEEASGSVINATGGTNGTVNGTITRSVTGKVGNCYTFDGSTGYINCGAISTSDVLTYAAWINPTGLVTAPAIVTSYDDVFGATLVIGSDGALNFQKVGAANIGSTASGLITTSGTWQHVAVTYDASGFWALFYNGVMQVNGTSALTFSHGNYIIGSTVVTGNFFPGNMDEVFISDKALRPNSVKQLYTNGTNGITYPF